MKRTIASSTKWKALRKRVQAINKLLVLVCNLLYYLDISSVMGFSGFGKPQKAARKFDLDAIFEKTKREAKTILSHNGEVLCVLCQHMRFYDVKDCFI